MTSARETARDRADRIAAETADSPLQTIRGECPALGRSASACDDQTHTTCWAARAEMVQIEHLYERHLARIDPTY